MGPIYSDLGLSNQLSRGNINLSTTSIVGISQTNFIIAGGANTFNDISYLKLISYASFPVKIELRDTISGSVVDRFILAASGTFTQSYNAPLKQTTANTTWTLSASTADATNYIAAFAQSIKNL